MQEPIDQVIWTNPIKPAIHVPISQTNCVPAGAGTGRCVSGNLELVLFHLLARLCVCRASVRATVLFKALCVCADILCEYVGEKCAMPRTYVHLMRSGEPGTICSLCSMPTVFLLPKAPSRLRPLFWAISFLNEHPTLGTRGTSFWI